MKVAVENIKFHSGAEIQCKASEIVVFVGPNNCGKSELLRGINALESAIFCQLLRAAHRVILAHGRLLDYQLFCEVLPYRYHMIKHSKGK